MWTLSKALLLSLLLAGIASAQVTTGGGGGGGGGSGTPTPKNIIDITAPPYNVIFDTKWDLNATYSTTSTNCNGNTVTAGHCLTISGSTSAGAPTFAASDVGKTVFGYTGCPNTGEQCSTTALARTTITQVFDATHASSSAAASANSSGAGSTMVWGTTGQTTAIQNAFGAMTANPSLASAIQLPCLTGQQQGGLIWDGNVSIPLHSANLGVYGCPNGATVLIPTADMPGGTGGGQNGIIFNDAGTAVGQNNLNQYGTGDVFQNILWWGAGAPTNTFGTASHNVTFIQGPAYLNNFSTEAYLWNVGGNFAMNGINCVGCTIVNSTDFAGGNTAQVTNSIVDGGVWGGGNSQQPGLTAISTNGILQAGTTLRGNAYIFPGIGGTVGLSVPATNTGTVRVDASNVQNISMAGGTLLLVGNGQVNNSQTNSVSPLTVTGGSVDMLDNVWNISNTRAWVTCTGGQVRSLGGNTGLAGTGGFTITPPCNFVADGHSVKAVCTGTVTASTTVALISTGTSLTGTALTTACTGTTLDKGIPAQGARTLQNLTCTSSATTVAVVCTVMTSHNGGAFASSLITCTMTAATSCTDGVHTLTLADGDYVTIQAAGGAAETGANIKAIVEWE